MNQHLPTYPNYKPAGLPWLVQVPAHWEQVSLRAITQPKNQRGRADLQLLSVYREYGVIPKASRDDNHNADGADLSTYKVVKPGYLVLNKMKTWQGSLGVSLHEGIVSPAYIVCAITRADIDLKYLNMLLRSRPYVHVYNSLSFGVRVGQWDMRYDDFKQIKVLLPSLPEQQRIVAFLEAKIRQIARLLRAKRQLIKLLQEQKQALIHRAVTQGLDPEAPRKDSGVAWLGEVPANWTVAKFKRCLNFIRGGMTPSMSNPEYWEGPIPWVSPKDMKQVFVADSELHVTTKALAETGLNVIPAGSILAVVRSGILRNKFPLSINTEDVTLNQDMKAFQPKVTVCSPQYLYTVLKGLEQEVLRQCRKAVATVESIEIPDLANMLLPFPPLENQQEILDFISREAALIDQTVSRAQREIELIQEYRTRLLADVVTGRVDVRHLADAASAGELPAEDELELEDEESEEELLIETEDGRE